MHVTFITCNLLCNVAHTILYWCHPNFANVKEQQRFVSREITPDMCCSECTNVATSLPAARLFLAFVLDDRHHRYYFTSRVNVYYLFCNKQSQFSCFVAGNVLRSSQPSHLNGRKR